MSFLFLLFEDFHARYEAEANGELKNVCYDQRPLKHFLWLEGSNPLSKALFHYFILNFKFIEDSLSKSWANL